MRRKKNLKVFAKAFHKFFTLILLFSLKMTFSFSQEAADSTLFSELEKNGFYVRAQNLADSGSFPKNLIVELQSPKKDDIPIDNVIFAFTQDFFEEKNALLLMLLKELKDLNLPYDCTVILTTNDEPLPLRGDSGRAHHPRGTEIFTQSLGNADNYCSIVIEESAEGKKTFFARQSYSIVPGGNSDVSPSWLVKAMCDSCTMSNAVPSIPMSFSMLFRLGLARETRRVSNFMTQSIPSVGISLMPTKDDLDIIINAAKLLSTRRNSRWDRHYTVFQLGKYSLWPGEAVLALSYMIFALIAIFSVSFFSFRDNSKNKATIKDLTRTFFLILAYLFISTLTLAFAQFAFSFIRTNPLILTIVKIASSFLVITIIFIIQIRQNFQISMTGIGFLMVFTSAVNIFIFTAVDLSLIFMFFIEYLIFFIARRNKNLFYMIPLFMISSIPFLFMAMAFIRGANFMSLRRFALCPFSGNLLMSFALMPLFMQLFRILLVLGIFGGKKQRSKTLILAYSSIVTLILFVFIATFSYTVMKIVYSSTPAQIPQMPFNVSESEKTDGFTVNCSEENFMELTIHHVVINSPNKILRYSASLESEEGLPLYDSNFAYTIESGNKVFFELPDFPSGEFEIVYSSAEQKGSILNVEAFIQDETDASKVEHQKKQIFIRE